MARKTPKLDLTPELPDVVSRDFNLFYRPEAEPEVAGLKEFTASLDNFVNGAGSSMVIGSLVKEKKENSAKAVQDFAENKMKFKEAVKAGKIDKTANPFYLDKYKELSLNEYASEFNDRLIKKYGDLNVINDINEGGFDNFYQDTLKEFITEKNLGVFNPIDLEEGFFKETSNYRASLEAQHKQSQLELFKKKFNEKVKNRVVGIVSKYKNYELNPTIDDTKVTSSTVFELIANDINKEIQSIIDVTGDGRDTIDIAFQGLADYVSVATDYEFAKKIINNVPKYLVGGTDSLENIGRIKTKKEELYQLLIEKQQEKTSRQNDFINAQKTNSRLTTYNYLETQRNNPDFNIVEYYNNPRRTTDEKIAIDQYKTDQLFDGGKSDDRDAIILIEGLLKERKFLEAHEKVSQLFKDGRITRATKNNYFDTRIANSRDFGEHPLFNSSRAVSDNIKALESVLASNASQGDKLKATNGIIYIENKLYSWIKDNQNDPKYVGKPSLLEDDFEKQFLKIFKDLKNFSELGTTLFGKGETGFSGSGTIVENIDAEIQKKKDQNKSTAKYTNEQIAIMTVDMKAISSAEFREKHKVTKEQFRKDMENK